MSGRAMVALAAGLILASPAGAQSLAVSPPSARPPVAAPAGNFTGSVTVTPIFRPNMQINANVGEVAFSPGARSVWHTHPAGQLLIVTAGTGWMQDQGGPKREIGTGDVVWIAPDSRYWHGATETSAMRHIAITPLSGNTNVDWLEPVSDADYHGAEYGVAVHNDSDGNAPVAAARCP